MTPRPLAPARRRSAVTAVLAAVAVLALVPGCAVEVACSAVGYPHQVSVEVVGSTDALAAVQHVELCTDDGCSTPIPETGSTPPSHPVEPTPPFYLATERPTDRWTIDTFPDLPEEAVVRAVAADGSALVESTVLLAWTRTGGSDACGGPHRAGLIEFELDD